MVLYLYLKHLICIHQQGSQVPILSTKALLSSLATSSTTYWDQLLPLLSICTEFFKVDI